MNDPVYIIDAVRTPMARANGKMKAFSVDALSSFIIKALIQRNPALKQAVDEVVFGNAVSAGAGQNFVRKAMIDAGLPEKIHGYTVSSVCASGLQAVINASQAIQSGDADIIIAGSAESVSSMPELIFKRDHDIKKIQRLNESLIHDGLFCSVTESLMGLLCEDMAEKAKISRKEQDDYAFQSYIRAEEAQRRGAFKEEMINVKLSENKFLHEDETIRKNVTREILDSFEGAFKPKGTITAANSSAPCDGASGIILSSSKAVEKLNLRPIARITGYATFVENPREVFRTSARTILKVLEKGGLRLEQVDLFEICEAFSAQVVVTMKELKISKEKVNTDGGDIAMGHPVGAAGERALVSLVHRLKRINKKHGVVCACFGGGGATAVSLSRV